MGNVNERQKISQDDITAYNNFLCNYGQLHAEMLPDDAIQSATRMWCRFSPEQQMSYALMYPSNPNSFKYEMSSEHVRPPCSVALPKKKQNKPKSKLKAKTTATKCRTKYKPALPKKTPTKERRPAYNGIKKTLQKPHKIGFQMFCKNLRDKHSGITEEEIVKKAARAWCNMNRRQRRSFLR